LKFDDLSRKHDVFKLETIGDAWMGVTILSTEQLFDHTKRIAEFEIAAMSVADETLIGNEKPELGVVHIRAGFHSGPILANVVGSRAPK
jgi:class 3 adenylate cyclase